jgi:hypothetical protein
VTEPLDDRIRESLADLMAAAPGPKPFSDDPAAGKPVGSRRRFPAWVVAPVAAVVAALAIGLPVLLLRGGADEEQAVETTAPTSTVPVTQTTSHGTTTTLPGQPMVGDGPENPMPVGGTMTVLGWEIMVGEPAQGEAPVIFANPDGTFLVGVPMTATRVGRESDDGPATLSEDVQFWALGADGGLVEAEPERCPHGIAGDRSTQVGGTVEGNVCFSLSPAAADAVLLVARANIPVFNGVYLATEVSPEVRCDAGSCPVRYLQGPELTREEFLATDIGQILEATFIGGDAEAENFAYVRSDGFSIVSDSLVLGYRNGRPVSSFRLEGGRVAGWGTGDGSARLVSGDLSATGWNPVLPVDPNATVIPITVVGGACANSGVTTEIRFVQVVEDESSVQVVVWTSEKLPSEGFCAGVGIFLDAEIQLAAPLGDRALLDAGVFPAAAAGVTDEPLFPFHLFVSNQSTDIDPVTLEVWVDGDLVVDQAFEALGLHNWILFDLELAEGWHDVRAVALDGEVELQDSFYSSGEHWGILDFWYSVEEEAPRLGWHVQDEPFVIM